MRKKKQLGPDLDAKITGMSHDGRGITTIDGKITFVSGALEGEQVKLRYLKKRAQFDEATAIEILEPVQTRVDPECRHFGVCGGCSLQHMEPSAQIALKEKTLLEQLQHYAHTKPENLLPRLTASSFGYRKKARLGVKHVPGKNKVLVGFREKNSSFIADLLTCETLDTSVGHHLPDFSELFYSLNARARIPQVEIARDDTTTALIIRHLDDLEEQDLEKIKNFGKNHGYKIYLQPKGINSVHLIYPEGGSDLLEYNLPAYNLTLNFHPSQFTQVNTEINTKMIDQALELLELSTEDTVLDLFCGIGNFTLPLAKKAAHVVGVEGDALAVEQAKKNAARNQLSNASFYTENLFEPPFSEQWSTRTFSKLLLDPPRSGALEAIKGLKDWQPEKIVYVSCNPATLARDSALISENGYTLSKAGVMDMFPHTQHVESMALFIRR